jgi:hypothetical protein
MPQIRFSKYDIFPKRTKIANFEPFLIVLCAKNMPDQAGPPLKSFIYNWVHRYP